VMAIHSTTTMKRMSEMSKSIVFRPVSDFVHVARNSCTAQYQTPGREEKRRRTATARDRTDDLADSGETTWNNANSVPSLTQRAGKRLSEKPGYLCCLLPAYHGTDI